DFFVSFSAPPPTPGVALAAIASHPPTAPRLRPGAGADLSFPGLRRLKRDTEDSTLPHFEPASETGETHYFAKLLKLWRPGGCREPPIWLRPPRAALRGLWPTTSPSIAVVPRPQIVEAEVGEVGIILLAAVHVAVGRVAREGDQAAEGVILIRVGDRPCGVGQ